MNMIDKHTKADKGLQMRIVYVLYDICIWESLCLIINTNMCYRERNYSSERRLLDPFQTDPVREEIPDV